MVDSVLKRIAIGDKAAVQQCLKQYGGLVWSLSRRMTTNAEDAEDATQDIFLDLWKHASKFDPAKSSEATFIAMIARRRLIDRMRSSGRTPKMESIEIAEELHGGMVDESIDKGIDANRALTALAGLDPTHREAIRLSVVLGLTHREISEKMGLPLGTVKTNIRRGLLRVREMLGVSSDTSGEIL